MWLYDNKDKKYTLIRDKYNNLVGVWFWKDNVAYVFQKKDSNTTLRRELTALAYPNYKAYVYSHDFDLIEVYYGNRR